MGSFREALRKTILCTAVIGTTLGAVASADAQPYPPPPPGWAGPHYYWHGRHYHHRRWVFDRFHHRVYRYY